MGGGTLACKRATTGLSSCNRRRSIFGSLKDGKEFHMLSVGRLRQRTIAQPKIGSELLRGIG